MAEILNDTLFQDWRIHLDQMHQHQDGINTSLQDAKVVPTGSSDVVYVKI